MRSTGTAIEPGVAGAIDDTHTALAEEGLYLVRSSALAVGSIYPEYWSSLTGSIQVVAALTFTAMCVPELPGAAPCQ